ncbi:uncharacterized protein LOC144650588 [Oculina patagonica]
MYTSLKQVFLALWLVVVCDGSCPKKCTCTPFGSSRVKVKCSDVKQVPRDIPSNTVFLDLSKNSLEVIPKDTFQNLTSLKVIILNENRIRGGFYLPKSVVRIEMADNLLSLSDLKTILKGLKRVFTLYIRFNFLGPNLTSDVFAGLDKMNYLHLQGCHLENIEDGTFKAMKNLTILDLSWNQLSYLQPETLEGPADKLALLQLESNALRTILNRTFSRFTNLTRLDLADNQLTSVPDLSGVTTINVLRFQNNPIKKIARLATLSYVRWTITLTNNKIDYLPASVFQHVSVQKYIDLSVNMLQSIPDKAFTACGDLEGLYLNFNNISYISRQSFTGLVNLKRLWLIKNRLTFISDHTFVATPLKNLLLHGNAIEQIQGKGFHNLSNLQILTLFSNPLTRLPAGLFDGMKPNAQVFLTCKYIQQFPRGIFTGVIECAPSESSSILISQDNEHRGREVLFNSGLRCDPSNSLGKVNCSFCPPGSYSDEARTCVKCPAGGFYQDEMGETECKTCSNGTYVSEERHPGKSATDCWACPYGTRSNETAGYRACRCLHGFYRLDRFGPCSACPAYGIDCNDDTAILAPNYFWNWTDQTKLFYKSFVDNINTISPTYNKTFSKFNSSLPKPLKCPRVASCRGGIDSKCNEGYRGILCASCTSDHYLRFNACLKCPSMTVTLISSIGVIVIFVVVFMMVLWGDSKATSDSRTIADVIMSCFKIVIGFYQVVTGIFSSLVRVHWPVALISMEKYLHFVEGNIFQFAPFSCVHPRLRLDQFQKFVLIISVNALVVFLILVYLLLRGRYIKGGLDCLNSEKLQAMSTLKKSCYRNIFLFLLASYPITSNAIIRILPLPGSCVEICFTEDRNDCTSLLRADFSIKCFTLRHKFYWPIAAVFALYPVGFPLLVLLLIYKFRGSSSGENISFGLRVFFENYKKKFWFWEIIEMYRKLILTSLILFFGSDNISQNGFTVAMVSTFGVVYTLLCPIKDKFEDTLQILVLWIIFFDVCLGAMYTNYDVSESHKANGSIAINILFVLLNSSVLLVALGKGFLHMRFFWKTISSCPVKCFHFCCRGIVHLKRKLTQRAQSLDAQQLLIEEFY